MLQVSNAAFCRGKTKHLEKKEFFSLGGVKVKLTTIPYFFRLHVLLVLTFI
jgi:hypothetical protein